jgi:hypothetical protein
MKVDVKNDSDTIAQFLNDMGVARRVADYNAGATVFAQGAPATSVYCHRLRRRQTFGRLAHR